MAKRSELDRIGHSMAYDAACSVIESACVMEEQQALYTWFDTGEVDPPAAEHVTNAVRYLEMRGLLQRHPGHPAWVDLIDEDEGPPVLFDPEPIDQAGKIFVEHPNILVIDGVRVTMEVLVHIATPDPARWYRFERKGESIYVEGMLVEGKP